MKRHLALPTNSLKEYKNNMSSIKNFGNNTYTGMTSDMKDLETFKAKYSEVISDLEEDILLKLENPQMHGEDYDIASADVENGKFNIIVCIDNADEILQDPQRAFPKFIYKVMNNQTGYLKVFHESKTSRKEVLSSKKALKERMSNIKDFEDVCVGEDCETFDGKKGVVLEKGTLGDLFDGESVASLALESGDFLGTENALKVQLDELDEPSLYPYGKNYVFVRTRPSFDF